MENRKIGGKTTTDFNEGSLNFSLKSGISNFSKVVLSVCNVLCTTLSTMDEKKLFLLISSLLCEDCTAERKNNDNITI